MSIQTVWDILDYIGRFSTVLVILATLAAIYGWARGIIPAMLRLGYGLSKRKVAIFATGDNSSSLQALLVDSKIFIEKNIILISSINDIGKAEKATLYLIYWPDWKSELGEVLRKKNDNTALIVYAPQEFGFIPKEQMAALNNHRNVTVTNFRGRLLNDLVVSMITTSYEK